jgi:uncharacterized protein YwqG
MTRRPKLSLLAARREPAIWFLRIENRISHSKLGGLPSLPDGVEWPTDLTTKTPLHFLGQIDLSALPKSPLPDSPDGATLPNDGLLFFFADIDTYLDWEKKRSGIPVATRVIYTKTAGADRAPPATLPLFRHDKGSVDGEYASTDSVFPVTRLQAFVVDTFWWGDGSGFSCFEDDEDMEAMNASIGRATGQWDGSGEVPSHLIETRLQMFGAPALVQHEQEQARSEGRILLMQFMDGRQFDDVFGDCLTQFWIMPDDLRDGRFEHAWGTVEG